jgi:hypothetical protein
LRVSLADGQLVFAPVEPEAAFRSYLEGALEVFGIEADETERAVMAGVWSVYEPAMAELREADLSAVEPERDADLSTDPK